MMAIIRQEIFAMTRKFTKSTKVSTMKVSWLTDSTVYTICGCNRSKHEHTNKSRYIIYVTLDVFRCNTLLSDKNNYDRYDVMYCIV